MSTLDMSDRRYGRIGWRETRKTVLVYLLLSAAAIIVDHVYALFGHGVRSAAMTFMFLYPLLGGALIYFLLGRIVPGLTAARYYRLGYNLYNAGIATLTTGSFFKGILDIAGTASGYTTIFLSCGLVFAAAGLAILLVVAVKAGHRYRKR